MGLREKVFEQHQEQLGKFAPNRSRYLQLLKLAKREGAISRSEFKQLRNELRTGQIQEKKKSLERLGTARTEGKTTLTKKQIRDTKARTLLNLGSKTKTVAKPQQNKSILLDAPPQLNQKDSNKIIDEIELRRAFPTATATVPFNQTPIISIEKTLTPGYVRKAKTLSPTERLRRDAEINIQESIRTDSILKRGVGETQFFIAEVASTPRRMIENPVQGALTVGALLLTKNPVAARGVATVGIASLGIQATQSDFNPRRTIAEGVVFAGVAKSIGGGVRFKPKVKAKVEVTPYVKEIKLAGGGGAKSSNPKYNFYFDKFGRKIKPNLGTNRRISAGGGVGSSKSTMLSKNVFDSINPKKQLQTQQLITIQETKPTTPIIEIGVQKQLTTQLIRKGIKVKTVGKTSLFSLPQTTSSLKSSSVQSSISGSIQTQFQSQLQTQTQSQLQTQTQTQTQSQVLNQFQSQLQTQTQSQLQTQTQTQSQLQSQVSINANIGVSKGVIAITPPPSTFNIDLPNFAKFTSKKKSRRSITSTKTMFVPTIRSALLNFKGVTPKINIKSGLGERFLKKKKK